MGSLGRAWFSAILGVWALYFCSPLMGQVTTATVSGTVRDQTGAVVPGVQITITNVDTGVSRAVQTNQLGLYAAPELPLGSYQVRAEIAGFQTSVRRGITLTVGREAVVDFSLSVGAVAETVEVTGEAPLIETSSAALGGVVEGKAITDLPLNGRDIAALTFLEAGVSHVTRASTGGLGGGGLGQAISIAGGRHTSTGWFLDGTNIRGGSGATPAGASGSLLGVDTVREFRVSTNSYGAEYGLMAGGVINIVTKSGTNTLHGSLFEFHRNDDLDARNFFDIGGVPPFVRNQYGASAGGPIKRDRAFFFGAYEGLRERKGETSTDVVPSAEARATVTSPDVLRFLRAAPLPNRPIPGDPIRGEFVSVRSTRVNQDFVQGRIDYTLSSNHNLFGRYTYDKGERSAPNPEIAFTSALTTRHHYFTLSLASILSPSTVNSARFGLNRSVDGDLWDVVNKERAEALTPTPELKPFPILLTRAGVPGGFGNTGPVTYNLTQFDWADDLHYTTDRHSIKVGGWIARQRHGQEGHSRAGGEYLFDNIEQFLPGNSLRFVSEAPDFTGERNYRITVFAWYVQDTARLRSNLSLTVGMRHEFTSDVSETDGKLSNLRFRLDPDFTVGSLYNNTSLKNFAPRFGMVWDPFSNGKTSVRMGFGTFYEQILPSTYPFVNNELKLPPFTRRVSVERAPVRADIFSRLTPADTAVTSDFSSFSWDAKTPYLMQYNFSMQQQLASETVLTAGYSGSSGRHWVVPREGNSAIPTLQSDGRKFFPQGLPRRNPSIGANRRSEADGNIIYNALLLSLRQRLSAGLQLTASYTVAKLLNDGDHVTGGPLGGASHAIDPDDIKRNRGLGDIDQRQRLALNGMYDLPWGRGMTGVGGALLGGWQLNGIMVLASGFPDTPKVSFNQSRNLSTSGGAFDVPNLKPGASTNPRTGNIAQWWSPDSFELAAPGLFGNMGRNTLIGPGRATVDFSVFKKFPLAFVSEGTELQFRFESFNLFNRANFRRPSVTAFRTRDGRPDPRFGAITSADEARELQFGLKLTW